MGDWLLGDAAGELLPLEIALQDVRRAAGFGGSGARGEELLAAAAAAAAVAGLHFLEAGLALVLELVEIKLHGGIVSIWI